MFLRDPIDWFVLYLSDDVTVLQVQVHERMWRTIQLIQQLAEELSINRPKPKGREAAPSFSSCAFAAWWFSVALSADVVLNLRWTLRWVPKPKEDINAGSICNFLITNVG